MNEFIEKNKKLLQFYSIMARTFGTVLLLLGGIWLVWFLSVNLTRGDTAKTLVSGMSWLIFGFMVPGLAAHGIAQFIRYLLETEYQPGWILRRGDKFLCLLAGFEIVNTIFKYVYWVRLMEGSFAHLWFTQLSVSIVAKVLILVGLAQILRRIMPIIQESRTLV